MEKLSRRLNALALSETLAMAQKSRELKRLGIDIIDLSIGEPDFDTPSHVKDAAIQAIKDNYTHYPPVHGYLELREAICSKLKRDNGLDYVQEQIVVSNGAKQSIANVLLCIVDPGDEVVVPAPYWVSYPEMIKMAEGIPVYIPTGIDQNFKITPDQLKAAISSKTKALLFSSPSNPTGEAYTRDEFAALARVLEPYPDIVVISDEIYEFLIYEGKHTSIADIPELKDRVALVNGVSKGYAMTGWRIGYLAGPVWLAKACYKLQGQYTSGACTIAQKAAVEALLGDQTFIEEMVAVFKHRRNLVVSALRTIPGIKTNNPPGAFYVLPDVSHYFGKSFGDYEIGCANDLVMYLLDVAHVALVSGLAFGAPECIRISYSTATDQIQDAMQRLTSALAKLS